jgi:hypothetical protein
VTKRDARGRHEGVHGGPEALADRLHDHRRGEELPPVLAKEVDHAAFRLQPGDVEVEVHPVDALQLPGDVMGDDVGNGPW